MFPSYLSRSAERYSIENAKTPKSQTKIPDQFGPLACFFLPFGFFEPTSPGNSNAKGHIVHLLDGVGIRASD
jgi:hypothetical protein